MALTQRERREVEAANASGRQTVVFVHGLWMLASSWQAWRELFEASGYATVAAGWPDDPETVDEARKRPELFAGKTVKDVTDHCAELIGALEQPPVVIGHSFGGLITQQLAGRGLARASVPIDSAPFRGVLPLPVSALKSARPVLGNPLNWWRSVSLTYAQFRYAFVNAVSEDEARYLYETYPVPGSGRPLFQAATANVNPWTQITTDSRTPGRGPMLLIGGDQDHIAPPAILEASYRKQVRNAAVTKVVQITGRGHSLVFDSGWEEVARQALAFLKENA
jgi:pimeloyl-ACP methyl ester carboxylesterase